MAMYSAYFDESGHPDDGKFLVVAGAVADVEQWVHFEREWLETLAPLGTNLFHAADFEGSNPPFHNLTESDKDDLFEKLVGILCRRVERTCVGTISLDDYAATNAKYVFAEQYGHPYPSAARTCMGGVEEWAHRHSINVNETLFFFEDGAKHKGQVEWIAERDGLPVPVFRKKSEVTALQAGDMLAWLIHLSMVNSDVPDRYVRAFQRVEEESKTWRHLNLSDPDRVPTLLAIPLRDPNFQYDYRIVRKQGRRHAVTYKRPKDAPGQFKFDRKNDTIPEIRHVPLEELLEAARRYDESVANQG